MKRILLLLLFAISATITKAQSRADYDKTMGTVMELYNKSDADAIKTLYKDASQVPKDEVMDKERLKELKGKLGDMSAYKYIGDNNERVANLYKVTFANGTEVMGIALNAEGKITSLRFEKKSTTTERLMKAN